MRQAKTTAAKKDRKGKSGVRGARALAAAAWLAWVARALPEQKDRESISQEPEAWIAERKGLSVALVIGHALAPLLMFAALVGLLLAAGAFLSESWRQGWASVATGAIGALVESGGGAALVALALAASCGRALSDGAWRSATQAGLSAPRERAAWVLAKTFARETARRAWRRRGAIVLAALLGGGALVEANVARVLLELPFETRSTFPEGAQIASGMPWAQAQWIMAALGVGWTIGLVVWGSVFFPEWTKRWALGLQAGDEEELSNEDEKDAETGASHVE
jgi:hypothetical protein